MDLIRRLPPEVAEEILLYLGPKDTEILWNGIKEWKHLLNNDFWQRLCRIKGYEENGYLTSDIYSQCMLKSSLHWKAVYAYSRLKFNWKHGICKPTIIGTKRKRYDRIDYFDDEILVATSNEQIDIIKISTGKMYFSFNGNRFTSLKITQRHQNLIIFLKEMTLRAFNLKTKSWDLYFLHKTRIGQHSRLEICNNLLAIINPRVNHTEALRIVNLETQRLHFKICKRYFIINACFGDNIIILLIVAKLYNHIKILDLNGKVLMNFNDNEAENSSIEEVVTRGGNIVTFYSPICESKFRKISIYTVQKDTKSLHEIRSLHVKYNKKYFINDNEILFCNYGEKNACDHYNLWKFTKEDHSVAIDSYYLDMTWWPTIDFLNYIHTNDSYMFVYTLYSINYAVNMWCTTTGQFVRKRREDIGNHNDYGVFAVTQKRYVFVNSQGSLCMQNYDL